MDNNLVLEKMFSELVNNIKLYHPVADDIGMIRLAFEVARDAHDGQIRKSGEPFAVHPIAVASILSTLRLDKETIIAALLHDVVEDTTFTINEVENQFGSEVAFLVDGVTKLTKISNEITKTEIKFESFRKLILAAAKDIRVIIIKLADRLHNMRTLQYQSFEKQLEISNETMDIYAPIAQKLGISVLSIELEELAFSYLRPEEYHEIEKKVCVSEQEKKLENVIFEIEKELSNGKLNFTIKYEMKPFFSIYRKMVNRKIKIEEMYDVGAIKIIVDTVKDCYIVLGIMHSCYTPIPNRFKDYIATPKENMYQSLHTTVISKTGELFEIQVKTKEMDSVARIGVLSHWKYRESEVDAHNISMSQMKKSVWLKQILEWQQEVTNNNEFMELVKGDLDLFSEEISCLTPKGDVKRLKKGSTVIDFAYAVHSDIGNKTVGAKVNGRKQSLEYVLNNGDFVEIFTSENTNGPQKEWLSFVKTSNAKNKIKKWYRNVEVTNVEHEISKVKESENTRIEHFVFKIARCCMPVRGDRIIGRIVNRNKVIIHRCTCKNVISTEKNIYDSFEKVTWSDIPQEMFRIMLNIHLKNIEGVKKLEGIWNYINNNDIIVDGFEYNEHNNIFGLFTAVKDVNQIKKMINELEKLKYVVKVERYEE